MSLGLTGRFLGDVQEVTARLPGLGRAMVILRAGGATHERIGRIERVEADGAWILLGGAQHDSRLHAGAVAEIRFDRSSGMKDKILPRLNFLDAEGASIFAVVSLSGLGEFDASFSDLAFEDLPAEAPAEIIPKGAALSDDDAAYPLLREAQENAWLVDLRLDLAEVAQNWRGTIAEIKPAMGFLNIMTPDFHLHLQGGSLGSWRQEGAIWHALGTDGQPFGLSLHRVTA